MKGISPLVATVLLVAITVGIGGLIGLWLSTFTQTSTQITSQQGQLQIVCANGAIDVSTLKYCNSNMSGIIKNNGRILLGNISLQVIYSNASLLTLLLNDSSGNYLTLKPSQVATFNNSVGSSQYSKIWIYTNCSGVFVSADASDVSAC